MLRQQFRKALLFCVKRFAKRLSIAMKIPALGRLPLFFLFICLAVIGCGKQAPAPLDAVPGVRLGAVQLGASRAETISALQSDPTRSDETVADSLRRDEWTLPGGQHVVVLYDDDRVIQVQAMGAPVLAGGGITTQSTLLEIREVYPNTSASIMAHDMDAMYFDDVEQGIAFSARTVGDELGANSDGDLIAVYVHDPGREVIAIVHDHHH